MTEEERPEAKEQAACFAAIREIVQEIFRLMDAAYQQYSRLVEQVLNGRITEEREIERIMDGLVDFGDNPRLLETVQKPLCPPCLLQISRSCGRAHCPLPAPV